MATSRPPARRESFRDSSMMPSRPACGSCTRTVLQPLKRLPETMCGGVGLLDYDGDGWLDVYAVQGGPFPPPIIRRAGPPFRNRGDGTFEDVTSGPGCPIRGGYGHGVAVGDYDNDGHPDLFVTRWRSYTLLHNRATDRSMT